jgi:MEMO1 family protein
MIARGNEVRRPVVAGTFYPSQAQELESAVDAMLSQTTERKPCRLCGVVVPHAGYPYSGPIAGKAFSLLAHANDAPNRILLMGPPHFVAVRGIVAPSSSAFATPLGDVAVDVGTVEFLRDAGLVTIDDTPHTPEHSLEVELPFLQRVLEDFTIVPLLVDDASPEQVALIIETVLGKRTLLVVSSDLSHYAKQALLIEMLQTKHGANIDAVVKATRWLPHTGRAMISGLRKAGFKIEVERTEGKKSVYRIVAGPKAPNARR